MVKRRPQKGSYRLWLEAEVHAARETLSGNIRQRVKQMLADLRNQPRPSQSQSMDVSGLELPDGVDIRRIRLEQWRIVYAVHDQEKWVWVLAIRRRPPYDYQDLQEIVQKLSE
jgi:mRNA-degrading endonuclease RelE of RelBE toxin-antitoxin system